AVGGGKTSAKQYSNFQQAPRFPVSGKGEFRP
ncbi:unnamed protein product, partial [marine sediment metagenome]